MSPKATKKAATENVRIKVEPPLCIKGLTGKDLTNKVARTLTKFPEWVRSYYTGQLRYQKSGTSDKKVEFLEHLLSGEGMENPFFERLQKTVHESSETTSAAWISWKALTRVESTSCIMLGLEQGKMERRLSSKLDHADPETALLPAEEQYEYRYVVQKDTETTTSVHSVARSSHEILGPIVDVMHLQVEALKKMVLKTLKQWNQQRDDYKFRLERYADNATAPQCRTKTLLRL